MITLYTASWCGVCARLKGRLDKAGIAYTEVDVESDPAAASFVEGLSDGDRTVPVVVHADGRAEVDPDPGRLLTTLAG